LLHSEPYSHEATAIPIVALAIFSCKVSHNEALSTEADNYIFDTIVRRYKVDFNTQLVSGQDLVYIGDNAWLQYSFCKRGQLVFCNTDSDSTMILNLLNPDCQKIHGTINPGGIYVVTSHDKVLYYENGVFLPVVIMDLNKDVPEFAGSGMKAEWYKPGSDQKYRIPEDVIYFRVNQEWDSLHGKYSHYKAGYPISAKLNAKTRKLDFFGKTPKFAAYDDYGLLSNVFDLYIGDTIIYTDAISGRIKVVNTLTGEETDLIQQSRFQTAPVREFHYSKLRKHSGMREAKWEHGLLSASYEPLFFNPHDEKYYRLFHPQMNKYRADGLQNSDYDKITILMVLDRNLKLLEELVLPVNGSHFVKLFPSREGLTIPLKTGIKQEGEYAVFQYLRVRKKI
jgi:hypothetical protein